MFYSIRSNLLLIRFPSKCKICISNSNSKIPPLIANPIIIKIKFIIILITLNLLLIRFIVNAQFAYQSEPMHIKWGWGALIEAPSVPILFANNLIMQMKRLYRYRNLLYHVLV